MLSRRAVLGLGAAALGSLAAACSRSSRRPGQTGSSTDAPPTRSAAATSGPPPSSRAALPASRGPAVEIAHGTRTRMEVALTFHGAGDPQIARDLLAIFAAHSAKVTVLAVGSWLAANPGVAREIVTAGHDVGNHTYSHLDIDSLDEAGARAEIVRCRDVLLAQLGSGGTYFRPSQAQQATALVRRLAGEAGYPVSLSYDVDSLDYTDPGPAAIRRNVAAAQPGSIVSMHFGHPGTVTAMPQVLSDLATRGLSPVAASRLLRP